MVGVVLVGHELVLIGHAHGVHLVLLLLLLLHHHLLHHHLLLHLLLLHHLGVLALVLVGIEETTQVRNELGLFLLLLNICAWLQRLGTPSEDVIHLGLDHVPIIPIGHSSISKYVSLRLILDWRVAELNLVLLKEVQSIFLIWLHIGIKPSAQQIIEVIDFV